MNDLHAMDTLHEHIALVMVLYCIDYSAKSISTVYTYKWHPRYYFYHILACEVNHISELQDVLLYAF